jgi:hypothetical protein
MYSALFSAFEEVGIRVFDFKLEKNPKLQVLHGGEDIGPNSSLFRTCELRSFNTGFEI